MEILKDKDNLVKIKNYLDWKLVKIKRMELQLYRNKTQGYKLN